MNKDYFIYLIKSNKKFIGTIWLIGFILMPFITFIIESSKLITLQFLTLFVGVILSFIVPLFSFSYLYKKNSTDLYYSLPIHKKNLGIITFLFSVFLVFSPIIILYLLSLFIAVNEIQSLFNTLYFLFSLLFLLTIILVTSTFGAVIANNLLDGVTLAGSYLILVPWILAVFTISITVISNSIMVGQGNYNLIMDSIIRWIMNPLININNPILTFFEISSYLFYIVYIIVISLYTLKFFIDKDANEASNHTTLGYTYPLINGAVIFGGVFISSSINLNNSDFTFKIITTLILFILYLLLESFAKRKVSLNLNTIKKFVLIYVITLSFGYSFNKTNGFGMLKEIPSSKNLTTLRIRYHTDSKDIDLKGSKAAEISFTIEDKDLINELIKMHKDVYNNVKNEEKHHNEDFANITFYYNYTNNGSITHRYYSFDNTNPIRLKLTKQINDLINNKSSKIKNISINE